MQSVIFRFVCQNSPFHGHVSQLDMFTLTIKKTSVNISLRLIRSVKIKEMKTIQYYKLKNTNNIYQSFSLAKGAIHYIAQEYKGMRPLASENEDQLSKGSTKV